MNNKFKINVLITCLSKLVQSYDFGQHFIIPDNKMKMNIFNPLCSIANYSIHLVFGIIEVRYFNLFSSFHLFDVMLSFISGMMPETKWLKINAYAKKLRNFVPEMDFLNIWMLWELLNSWQDEGNIITNPKDSLQVIRTEQVCAYKSAFATFFHQHIFFL